MTEQVPRLERTAEGFRLRLRYGSGKQAKLTIPLRDEEAAIKRALSLKALASDVRSMTAAEARIILSKAAQARSEPVFLAIVKAVQEDLAVPIKTQRAPMTFAQLADEWTSGRLHQRFPDYVRAKRSAEHDRQRLDFVNKHVGKIALKDFTRDDAKRVMAELPEGLAPATRRHYAQLIAKVLRFAVWPLEVIPESPIPKGFLPTNRSNKAKAWLYPSEEAQLMRASDVPLERRMFWGLLVREGMRISEAQALTWDALDLEQGAIRLDQNKTDDPRSWALAPGVVNALKAFKPKGARGGDSVFPSYVVLHNAAILFREDLKDRAHIDRAELFQRTKERLPIRVHDLRATFVTLALANGKSESWVADRTGHSSSQMINKYRRAARMAQELGLGQLVPLDQALPELHEPRAQAQGESSGESKSWKKDPESMATKRQKQPFTAALGGAQRQNRTADTGIFNPLLYRLSYLGEKLRKKILKARRRYENSRGKFGASREGAGYLAQGDEGAQAFRSDF